MPLAHRVLVLDPTELLLTCGIILMISLPSAMSGAAICRSKTFTKGSSLSGIAIGTLAGFPGAVAVPATYAERVDVFMLTIGLCAAMTAAILVLCSSTPRLDS